MDSTPDPEEIEVRLLIEAVYLRWGYDFRDYATASLKRRVLRIVKLEKLSSISALQERLLQDPACMQRFHDKVLVSVTSMFRDPGFYRAFHTVALPILKEQSALHIWHVGCASGEEAYSMAILLHEEGLLDRSQIYATDLDQVALDVARQGIYPLAKLKEFKKDYRSAGGKVAFSEYYQPSHGHASHGHIVMRKDLSKNITWAQHNLVTDASFNEFDLVLCRNVLIYFNARLQERVHRLIFESLTEHGVLLLGRHESLHSTPHESSYRVLDRHQKIYQRVK